MTKIIAVANQKGGVGKTTTTMALGAALAQQNKKVLLVDLDPQGNLSSYLGFEPDGCPTISDLLSAVAQNQQFDTMAAVRCNASEQLDYIPATIALSNADYILINAMCRERVLSRICTPSLLDAYDYILIDCLPSLGILMLNALAAADSVLIPVQAQKFALDGMGQLLGVVELIKSNINPRLCLEGILITMTDNTNMSKAVLSSLESEYGALVYTTTIPKTVEATNSSYRQQSPVSYSSKLGDRYIKFTTEFLSREGR